MPAVAISSPTNPDATETLYWSPLKCSARSAKTPHHDATHSPATKTPDTSSVHPVALRFRPALRIGPGVRGCIAISAASVLETGKAARAWEDDVGGAARKDLLRTGAPT